MVRDNVPANTTQVRGQIRLVGNGDLTEITCDKNQFLEVYSEQSDSSYKYFPGYGVAHRDLQNGYADFDAEATGGGSGNDGEEINGTFRWEVYNDNAKEDLATTGPSFRTEDLRDAQGSSRTEKVMAPRHVVGAPEDGYLVLAFKVDSGQDGYVLESDDTAHSGTILDNGFPYTRMHIPS